MNDTCPTCGVQVNRNQTKSDRHEKAGHLAMALGMSDAFANRNLRKEIKIRYWPDYDKGFNSIYETKTSRTGPNGGVAEVAANCAVQCPSGVNGAPGMV